jgi:chromate transporter
VWFSLHVLFREVREASILGVGPDLPVLATLDWRAAVLAAAAMVAMLRFKAGMTPTLLGCGAAGLVLHFTSL